MWSPRQVRTRRNAAAFSAAARAGTPALTLRLATPDDDLPIARLASLDSARPPEPPVLTAELDGELCVAVSLTDLHMVADPFRFTSQVRTITLARAQQLRSAAQPQGSRRRRFHAPERTADRSRQPQSAA